MRIVDADHDLHLGLSPEAGIIGPSKLAAWIKVGQSQFAIAAEQLDSRLVIGFGTEVVIGEQFEANALRAGHPVFGMEFHPLATGADAVALALVRTHGSALGKGGESGCVEK